MFRKCLFIIFTILLLSCDRKPIDFKQGTFNLYINDSLSRIIERKGDYQLEYSPDKKDSEISFIKWQNDKLYFIETIINKDSIDPNKLFVKVDSIRAETAFLNAYMNDKDFNLLCKLIKIDDEIGNEFKELLKKDLPFRSE